MEGNNTSKSTGQAGVSTGSKSPSTDTSVEKQTLYVGNLKPGVSNKKLYDFFVDHKFSVVHANAKVSSKDFSNVFGVVKFCSEAEAQKALDTLNNSELDGCKIRLMWWNPSVTAKEKANANIYIKNLDSSITQKDLSDRFSEFGNVLSVKLETLHDGTSKGYGYVQFEEATEAKKAIDAMDGQEWKGKTITVCEFVKKDEREEKKTLKNNLYCRNFPSDFTEDNLRELFEKYGKITSLLLKPHEDGKKQAFICFETGEQAKQAIDELNDTKLEGCDEPLVVTELLNKYERREENLKNFKKIKDKNLYNSLVNNLYVNGIPKTCTEEEIKKEFEKFGPVSSIKMHMKPSREDSSKSEFIGAAFVCFENAEDAKNCVYTGSIEPMFGKSIFIDYYKPKEVKNKEKVEEVGVTIKQMIHNFMMTALSQTRGGGYRGRPTRGGRGGGRGAEGYTGYPGAPMQSSYGGAPPAGMNYGRPPAAKVPQSQGASYSRGYQFSGPPLPGRSAPQGLLPSGPPPMSAPPIGGMGQPPVSRPPPIPTQTSKLQTHFFYEGVWIY